MEDTALDTPAMTDAQAAALTASPLDKALKKPLGNAPQALTPSLFDVQAPVTIVPQTMRAEQITSLDGYDAGDGAVAAAVDALNVLTETTQRIIDAREVLRANTIDHEAQRVLNVFDLHAKLSPPVLRAVDKATDVLRNAIATTEAKLSEQVKDTAAGQEVRSYVRSLKTTERLPVLTKAIEQGDATVVGALLGSPSQMLTGLDLSADMRAALLRQWHTKRDPKTAARLLLMTASLGKLEAAGSTFLGSTDGLVGSRDATVRKARSAREKYRTVIGVSL